MKSVLCHPPVLAACSVAVLLSALPGPTASAQALTPLGEIERQLDALPPRPENAEARRPVLKALDGWALAEDTRYWDKDPELANPAWLSFYLRRVDKVLREARGTAVDDGVVIWKLYSSGFLAKTPQTVFGIDIVEGPFKDIRRDPADAADYTFKWTAEQRRAYAELVDVHFITHWHYDHASFALARDLERRGKAVVVPRQLADAWGRQGLGRGLRVLEAGIDHTLSGLSVRVFDGVQFMERDPEAGWVSGKHNAQNNVYWIKGGGVAVLHNGDNRGRDWYGWLEELKGEGKSIDVWLWILTWPRDAMSRVTSIHEPIVIPGHEHEVGHKPRHGVTLHENRYHGVKNRFASGKAAQLAWGESFRVRPRSKRRSR